MCLSPHFSSRTGTLTATALTSRLFASERTSSTSSVASIAVALQVQSRTFEDPSSQSRLSARTGMRTEAGICPAGLLPGCAVMNRPRKVRRKTGIRIGFTRQRSLFSLARTVGYNRNSCKGSTAYERPYWTDLSALGRLDSIHERDVELSLRAKPFREPPAKPRHELGAIVAADQRYAEPVEILLHDLVLCDALLEHEYRANDLRMHELSGWERDPVVCASFDERQYRQSASAWTFPRNHMGNVAEAVIQKDSRAIDEVGDQNITAFPVRNLSVVSVHDPHGIQVAIQMKSAVFPAFESDLECFDRLIRAHHCNTE